MKKIKNALISVFDKDGLEPIVRKLNDLGVTIYSTGGTQIFINSLGINVVPVEDITSYPSILGGRVKTLHPKVFGGILARRNNQNDIKELAQFQIPELDLVIVDLYPFEATVASNAPENEIIEKIDIGGISLIRATAKNWNDTVIVPSQNEYAYLFDILNSQNGQTSDDQRRHLAARAFAVSSHYDTQIFNYFNKDLAVDAFRQSFKDANVLRYGENPHQKGFFYGNLDAIFDKLNGKELSYNNLLDVDAAVNLMAEFKDCTVAIIKHNNACGLASRKTLKEAWKDALAGDPVSAFGGIIITNQIIDEETATEISKLFFEILIAPGFDQAAQEILSQKKNRILLRQKAVELPSMLYRSALNGVLVQDKDLKTVSETNFKYVTELKPNSQEIEDLIFANKLVKNTKSNTIVLAKNKTLLASGTGQTSRVDALKQAIAKAKDFGFELNGAVMASDAFFPFADCVEIANNEGIKTVIQPGGSIKDQDSIDFCNAHQMKMVTTGFRHFKH